ncbi:MAG: phosphatidate cytidylyltransferase [Planctomycetota bacterium]|nr:phosphatidate cytidylyltransferase [Planctomycetota bacterium]
MPRDLQLRLLFGAALIAIVGSAVALDLGSGQRWGALALGGAAAALGAREFARLARVRAAGVRLAPMLLVSLALVAIAHCYPGGVWAQHCPEVAARLASAPLEALVLGAGLVWATLSQMVGQQPTAGFFAQVGGSLFGMLYLGVNLYLLERLALLGDPAQPDRGLQWLACYLVAVKCGDVTAYFGGRAFGRHALCPAISPGKTWEGFACSFLGAIGGTWLMHALFASSGASPFAAWWQPVIWGLVLGPLGAAGDLAESCMKRDAAMKDSGRGAPGFGGYLDLLDAVLFAAPVAFLLAVAM